MLRHATATLAYHAAKVLRNPPEEFEEFRAGPTTRSAIEILSHMSDLLEWTRRTADGSSDWREPRAGDWHHEVARFFSALKSFDDRLASGSPLAFPAEKFLQGPIADVLTHVGQLATLRRLAGSGIRGEAYFNANITIGHVGMDQPKPEWEFD